MSNIVKIPGSIHHVFDAEDVFVLVKWPESQEYMDEEWFQSEAKLTVKGKSNYMIPIKRMK